MQFETFDDYWLAYLSAHKKPLTRACHYLGTVLGLFLGLIASIVFVWWAWFALGFIGYGIALASHPFIEGNMPFAKKPLWGLVSDLRMLWLAITRKLDLQLRRLES